MVQDFLPTIKNQLSKCKIQSVKNPKTKKEKSPKSPKRQKSKNPTSHFLDAAPTNEQTLFPLLDKS